jgi:16S rRNA G966 N2-methylase RsmD
MTKWNGQVHPAAELFPMIDDEAAQSLAADIKAHGLIEPGWLMPDGTLLDGRNRQRACELAGVGMNWRTYDGDDPITFAVSLNIKRRHLTIGQKALIGLGLLPMYEAEAKVRQIAAGKATKPGVKEEKLGADLPQAIASEKRALRARDRAAQASDSSSKAIAQAKRVSEQAPDLLDNLKDGSLALDAAEKQTKRRVAQAKEQAAREIKVAAVTVDHQGPGWRLLAGDFRERLLDLPAGSVDLIVTDPPYPNEFLPLYSDLSRLARHVLSDDGICVVMTGQIALAEVMARLGENLNYGWVYALPLPGANSRIMGRHVMQCWKPLLAFSKNAWPSGRIDWHPDMLDPSHRSKDRYRWEQDSSPIAMLIDDLCPQAGTVLDPFAGTGAFGRSALAVGRRFIGVEMDAERASKTGEEFGHADAA